MNATGAPVCDMRSAIPKASADLPLPTSPPSTTRSPRRMPPPSQRSTLGKPVATVSPDGCPSEARSTRFMTREIGEMSFGRRCVWSNKEVSGDQSCGSVARRGKHGGVLAEGLRQALTL